MNTTTARNLNAAELLAGTTSGPWTAEITTDSFAGRMKVYGRHKYTPKFLVASECEPQDARLIAAAPQLAAELAESLARVAELEALLGKLVEWREWFSGAEWHDPSDRTALLRICESAIAALAKVSP